MLEIAQAAEVSSGLDWKHALLAALLPAAFLFGRKIGNRASVALAEKLRATGHPQLADASEFLARKFAEIANTAEKQALARAAVDEGLDHPAIEQATQSIPPVKP